jgi:hypothetical protein
VSWERAPFGLDAGGTKTIDIKTLERILWQSSLQPNGGRESGMLAPHYASVDSAVHVLVLLRSACPSAASASAASAGVPSAGVLGNLGYLHDPVYTIP